MSAPAVATDAVRLRLVIGRLSRQLRQHEPDTLTASQLSMLATVQASGRLRLSDLAAREGIALPSASRIVATLESDGFIARTGDPADGRSSLVALTEAGHSRLEELQERRTALLASRIAKLSTDDRALLRQSLAILEDLVTITRTDHEVGTHDKPTGEVAGQEVR